jgi:hypothetical protein
VVVKDPGYKPRMDFLLLLVSGILRDHLTAAEGRTAMRFLPFSRLLLLFSRLLVLHRAVGPFSLRAFELPIQLLQSSHTRNSRPKLTLR